MLEETFVRDLRKLAHDVGLEAGSFESGHDRWSCYRRAMRLPGAIDQLISLIGREPDNTIAASVSLSCLEQVPGVLRERVVSALPDGYSQDLARARMADLSVLDDLVSRSSVAFESTSMESWSQWLQLRAAKLSSSRKVLEYLASSGVTKRIRREALARAKEIGG
ncbi:hypothetical protein ACFORO_38345 [Amycolatopsis halotolerans]|uniref:Uncharacterized protein n=1 Tax=Amycolatopsis halotolerans TaxID=330083 RepID=A0ABV7QSJ8_9PSEU